MNLEKAIEIENKLFNKEIRNNYKKLSNIISEDFIEVDYLGNKQTKESVLNSVVNEDLKGYTIERENYKISNLNKDIFSINYLCYLKSPEGKKERLAKRISTWKREGKDWRLISHKALPQNIVEE